MLYLLIHDAISFQIVFFFLHVPTAMYNLYDIYRHIPTSKGLGLAI